MPGPVGFNTFSQNIAADSDSAVRFSKNTGKATTAEHGFMSRTVRWFQGPTKQDIQDNRQIINDFHKALAETYGPEIATAALLHARKDMEQRDGSVFYRPAEPLTARQVKDALEHAQNAADGPEHHTFMRAVTNQVLRFTPGGSKFDEAAQAKGVDPKDLSDDQQLFILNRLVEEVGREARQLNRLPDSSEVKSMAGKLARQVAQQGPEWAAEANKKMEALTRAGGAFVTAMSEGSADSVGLLADLIGQGEDAIPFLTFDGDFGTDDRNKGALGGLREAVTSMTPGEARELYDEIAASGSGARKLMAAFMSSENRVSGLDGPKVTATGQISQFMLATVQMIARRAGVEDSDQAVDQLMRSVERDKTLAENPEVGKISKGFDKLLDERADFIREQARIALEEEQAASKEAHLTD